MGLVVALALMFGISAPVQQTVQGEPGKTVVDQVYDQACEKYGQPPRDAKTGDCKAKD